MADPVQPSGRAVMSQVVSSLAPRLEPVPSVADARLRMSAEAHLGARAVSWAVEVAAGATELLARRSPGRVLATPAIQRLNEEIGLTLLLTLVGTEVPPDTWARTQEPVVRKAAVDRVPIDRAVANVRAIQQYWTRQILARAIAVAAGPDIQQKIVIVVTQVMDTVLDTQIKIYLTEQVVVEESLSAQRRRLVEDLVEGRVVDPLAVERLGLLDLDDHHVAMLLTAADDSLAGIDVLHLVAVRLKGLLNSKSFLLHEAAKNVLWIWASDIRSSDVTSALVASAASGTIRVGIGSPHPGRAGFRRTHLEAVGALRIAEAGSVGPVVRYRDVALATLLRRDAERAAWFVEDHLGGLADTAPATRELRKTLQYYHRCQMRLVPTALELGVHRNTLVVRLRRIEELLGHPVLDNLSEVMCAMMIMDIDPPLLARPPVVRPPA